MELKSQKVWAPKPAQINISCCIHLGTVHCPCGGCSWETVCTGRLYTLGLV